MGLHEDIETLVDLGAGLVASSFAEVVHGSGFADFKRRGIALLLRVCGPQHALYEEFKTTVRSETRNSVESGVNVLRKLLAEAPVPREPLGVGLEELLDPIVRAGAYQQFIDGHYREATFNAIVCVFDLLRSRTGLDLDGSRLAAAAFGERPRLLIADVGTETGRSEQIGFMQLLQGAYSAIRNPKAHSLAFDTSREVAAQYLVFASILARRITEAKVPAA